MEELQEMIIAMLAIVVAFSIAFGGGIGVFFQPNFFLMGIIFLFTIGISFIAHEMGHKYAAEKFGSPSRFMMWPQGILLMLLLAPLGFIFAAPGAVYIFKRMNARENGIVSLTGPVVNQILFIFFALVIISSSLFDFGLSDLVLKICVIGMYINALLATFNLLPIFILDGAKVIRWNFKIWLAAFLISLLMLFSHSTIASI